MARVYERVFHLNHIIPGRVWCKATDLRDPNEQMSQATIIGETVLEADKHQLDAVGVAERLATLDFVNAVEITVGVVSVLIYPDWP